MRTVSKAKARASMRRAGKRSVGVRFEQLEQMLMYAADPVINEFMAKNSGSLLDGYGLESDWIEIHNRGDAAINLAGWHLTDDLSTPNKWTFPSKTLNAGGYLVVFASSKNTTDPSGNLHTNFSLSQEGERLALTRPDNSVASVFNADGNFPAQQADVSYGIGRIYSDTTLVGKGAAAKSFVPTNGSIDNGTWVNVGYNDSGWTSGTTGVGFDTGAYEDNTIAPVLLANWDADSLLASLTNNAPVSTWTSNVGTNMIATASGSPIFRSSAINGHAAISFVPGDGNDNLRVPSTWNPMSNADNFTMVVAFRANSGTGTSGGSSNYTANSGIVDGDIGSGFNDWGVGIAADGAVGAGIATATRTVYSSTGKADGNTHILVFTRRDGVISLYVDGGNGVTRTDASTASRIVADMVFGSGQDNTRYLNGDIAQVQVFEGWMTASRAYNAALTLGVKYGVSIAPPSVIGISPTATWAADSLNSSSDNALISTWASTGTVTANATATNTRRPTLQKNELNGHSVVRFDGTSDFLRVAAASNPMANATDFSIATVFRTSTGGLGANSQWYNNAGIVDAEQGGVTNDWGLAMDGSGRLGAGFGNPDSTMYSQAGLNNGQAHVVVLTRSGTEYTMSIDGGAAFTAIVPDTARNSADMVFGALQTSINFFAGDIAEIQIFNTALDEDTVHSVQGTLGDKYGISIAPARYESLVGLNLESAMSGLATTAAIRVPFTVDNPSQYNRLTLSMQYDDGFVAYLNGTEIARRNAPGGAITYTSTALGQRLDDAAIAGESIDISSFLSLLQGGGATNVLAIRALNTSINDPDLLMIPKLIASTVTDSNTAFFTTPTPGAANTDGYAGILASPTFSLQHGYYDAPINVTISGGTPGATLVYTLDGSEPTLDNGVVITPANSGAIASTTLNFNATAKVRAAIFKNSFIPSASITSTYVFVASVLTQTNTARPGAYWNTEMDPEVLAKTDQGWTVEQAIKSLPAISIVMNDEEMFGTGGIYSNPQQKGIAWERETSVEYFDPNNPTAGSQINAGIRIQGGSSRDPSRPKRSFRLYFRSEYGAGSWEQPLYGIGAATTNHDKLVLRAFNNNSWANEPLSQNDYVHDMWARQLAAIQSGTPAAVAGAFVQLYINGQYWGLYTIDEDPDDGWTASHFGGEKEDWEVMEPDGGGGVEVKSGNGTAYYDIFNTLASATGDGVVTQAEYNNLKTKVDMQSVIDFMLNNQYRGDRDSPAVIWNRTDPRNFYAYKNLATNSPYKFATWDGELSMDDLNIDTSEVSGNLNPATIWHALRGQPEFAQQVADSVYKLFYNDGALSVSGTNKPVQLFQSIASQIDKAIIGESARWGDAKRASPYLRNADWLNEINDMVTGYMPYRTGIVLNQLKADFPVLNSLPPIFKIGTTTTRGGKVTAGTTVTLATQTSTSGEQFYYTTDGSDPRLPGGGIAPTATLYTAGVVVNASTTFRVRSLTGTTWSGMDVVAFSVDAAASVANLTITEFNYHPTNVTPAELAALPAADEDEYEYVELMNIGTTSMTLAGVSFTGITAVGTVAGQLDDFSIPAGGRVVIVKNLAAFRLRYGNTPIVAGTYTGSLSNSGETLAVKAPGGAVIRSVTYVDSGIWPVRADGDGSTLEVLNPSATGTAFSDVSNWRASYAFEGTAGAAPITAPTQDVVINELITANSDGVDKIELYNRSGAAIDIGGWYLSDSGGMDYQIPSGTMIAAGGYVVFTSADFNTGPNAFGLSGSIGGNVYLIRSVGGVPAGFADDAYYIGSVVGESLGRSPDGTGALVPISTQTPGAANAAPRIGPAVITEVMYNPTGANLNLQYVEIQNQGNTSLILTGWKFDQGITFSFTAGTTLAAHEAVLVVRFNPTTDTAAAAAFRSAYGLDSTVRLIGPFTGDLSATGEMVRLVRNDAAHSDEPSLTPLVQVDQVTYGTSSPWAIATAGQSLTRASNAVFGETSTNWTAGTPTAGAVVNGHAYFAGNFNYTYGGVLTTLDSLTLAGTGTVTIGGDASAVLRAGALSIASGATLDIGLATVILDYSGSSPASAVEGWLKSGYAGGAWTGNGIRSSGITAGRTVGWAEATKILGASPTTFGTQPIDASTIILRQTVAGDANLDRTVNFDDLLTLAQNYSGTGKVFAEGNFNYDATGTVDFDDLLILAQNYNGTMPSLKALQPAPTVAPAASKTATKKKSAASAVIN